MNCPECMYISGHDQFCTRGTADRLGDTEQRLLARIETQNERIAQLEKDVRFLLEAFAKVNS